jgi:hypothetical protein
MRYSVRIHTNSQTIIIVLVRLGGMMAMSQTSVVYSVLRKMLENFRECLYFWLNNNDRIDRLAFWEAVNIGWYEMYVYVGPGREL